MEIFFHPEFRVLFIVFLMATFLPSIPLNAAASQQPAGDEKILFEAVNRERAERGLRALKWDATLAEAAKRHTALMAGQSLLSHQLPGEEELQVRAAQAGARFIRIAENIGEASAVEELHNGWMHSPPHRANILSPQLTSIGIAVQQSGELFYATQDFSTDVAELSLREQENRIGKLIEAKGLRVKLGAAEARAECRTKEDTPQLFAGAVVHFETADLTRLPSDLENLISQRRFHTASVGACAPSSAGGFTRYRLAVLLY